MTTSVVFPPRAAPALGLLKSRNNDIEVFVEDTSAPNLWVFLLRKYLPSSVRLDSVNVLGSKRNVIDACKADQAVDGRKKLYIIDGDLDILLGKPKPRLRHLYRLRRYCVENYLLDERALISAATILNPKLEYDSAQQEVNYSGWLDGNRDALLGLFIFYAVTFELKRDEETVGYSVNRLLEEDTKVFRVCKNRVFRRVIGLYRCVRSTCTAEEIRNIYDRVRHNSVMGGVEQFVSGKDYIFPLLYLLLRKKFRVNIPINSFKTLVAQCIERPLDPYLLRRLRIVSRK